MWPNFFGSRTSTSQSYKFDSTNPHVSNFYYFSLPVSIKTRPATTKAAALRDPYPHCMKDEQNTVICFSGHRYYAAAPEDEARLAAAVEAAWEEGYRVFISGMAPGFDLAAAEAVVRLRRRKREQERALGGVHDGAHEGTNGGVHGEAGGSLPPVLSYGAGRSHRDIRLVAAVPFARQAAGYSADDRTRYEVLLAAADEVVVLSERYSYGCYYRRDDWMVERAGRIICWYDGSNSGTRYTVRRAVAAGLEVVNLFRDPAGMLF